MLDLGNDPPLGVVAFELAFDALIEVRVSAVNAQG